MTTRLHDHVAGALDPAVFAKRLSIDLDPWQLDVLRNPGDRLALNVHRQGGKSTIAAILGLHRALYTPGALVLIVSNTQRQSSELFRKLLTYYRRLGRPIDPEVENRMSLELETGSRVIAVPGAEGNIRSYSVDLLIIDEAAEVADGVYGAVSPMVAVTKGSIITMGTPKGRRGWWYETTRSPYWRTITVPATECPRLSAEWLSQEQERIGAFWYRQEYLCEFTERSGQLFTEEMIARIFEADELGVPGEIVPLEAATSRPEEGPSDVRAIQRTRRTRQQVVAIQEEVRRGICSHFWGPPVGSAPRCCTKCGEVQVA